MSYLSASIRPERALPLDAVSITIPDRDQEVIIIPENSPKGASTLPTVPTNNGRNYVNLTATALSTGPLVYCMTRRPDIAVGAVALVGLGFYLGCRCPRDATELAKFAINDSVQNTRSFFYITFEAGRHTFRVLRAALSNLNRRNLERLATIAGHFYRASSFLMRTVVSQRAFSCIINSGHFLTQAAIQTFRGIRTTSTIARRVPQDVVQIFNHFAEGVGAAVSFATRVAGAAIRAPLDLAESATHNHPIATGYITLIMFFYFMISNMVFAGE